VVGCLLAGLASAQPVSIAAGSDPLVAERATRLDRGRFTVVAYPSDLALARSLIEAAVRDDTFPGLPRPVARVVVAIAPDEARFREWVGPGAPEWGAAIAMPASQRVVMRGRGARATAGGDPRVVFRHELAHLALHEAIGELPPRWFDEGYASYAAGEWGRQELLATNRALLLKRFPSLDDLNAQLTAGEVQAGGAYALSHRAVAEMAAMDPVRGLNLLFRYWKETGRLDSAMRRAYGITLDGFEERWQWRTRNSYGILALVGDITVISLVFLVVILPFLIARARRNRERMAILRYQDVLLDARAAAAGTTVEVLLGIADPAEAGELTGDTELVAGSGVRSGTADRDASG